jgi:hypothetical protein
VVGDRIIYEAIGLERIDEKAVGIFLCIRRKMGGETTVSAWWRPQWAKRLSSISNTAAVSLFFTTHFLRHEF